MEKKELGTERQQGAPATASQPDDSVQGTKIILRAQTSVYHENTH